MKLLTIFAFGLRNIFPRHIRKKEALCLSCELKTNEISIKYIHQETGEVWSAKLIYHPDTKEITFINGKMLKKGPNSPQEDAPEIASDFEGVHWIEPDTMNLIFISENPHAVFDSKEKASLTEDTDSVGKTINKGNEPCTKIELADRVIYGDFDDERQQIKCRFITTGEVVTIVDNEDQSPLSGMACIVNAWATADGKGALFVIEERGTEFQTLSLIKINDENRVEYIDSASGISPNNQFVGVENITDDMLPDIIKQDDRIKVYSPDEDESYIHFYDMNGKLIE